MLVLPLAFPIRRFTMGGAEVMEHQSMRQRDEWIDHNRG
jgi:hypothetical protein